MFHAPALFIHRHFMTVLALAVLALSPIRLYAQQESPSAAEEQHRGNPTAVPGSSTPWAEELKKYPGLADELSVLLGKLLKDVHFPAARNDSRLLPLVPSSSIAYAALPNYGDALTQALKIFHDELAQSSVLRDWWQHGSFASDGPKIEDALDKLAQFHQFLGPELALSSTVASNEPRMVVFAEVRKAGLKTILQQWNQQVATKSNAKLHFRILEPQELATAKDSPAPDDLVVLLRPDFVVSADKVSTLRDFNARLDSRTRDFTSTPFAQRILTEYHDGITALAAFDIHRLLEKSYPVEKQSATFKQSGLADTQYLIWDHKTVSASEISQMELSFTSPRHGAAAWLAEPAPLGSLDFVPPQALMVLSLFLASPSQIFDDLKAFTPNSRAFAAIPGVEQALGLSLKDDLLSLLTGELTFEFDAITASRPVWRAFLGTKNSTHLRRTFATLLASAPFRSESAERGDLTFYSLEIPGGDQKPTKIAFTFSDGYMVLGPTIDAVDEAIQLHRSGATLGKSQKFLATIPPGHTGASSALFYEDPNYIANFRFGSFLPQVSSSVKQAAANENVSPVAAHFYGEKSAIREISTNSVFDAAGVLIVAAIAIPDLMRSRIAANEASAVGSVRTLNTAQVTYDASYPDKGFARNILSMGENPTDPNVVSPEHADLLDPSLAGPTCTADGWCTKSGYRFRVDSLCKAQKCGDYIVLATPISQQTGARSFCCSSDGMIRLHVGAPLTAPISVTECKSWAALE